MNSEIPLEPGEQIARTVRRSRASLVPPFLLAAALTLAAAGLAYLEGRYPAYLPFPHLLTAILIAVMGALAAAVFAIASFVFDHNYLVFTSTRLIQIEQLSLFNRRLSQLYLAKVQDATGIREGLAGTIFNYGDLQVQSAGETEQFIFHYAPHPIKLADDVLQAKDLCLRFTAAIAGQQPPAPRQPGSTPAPPVGPQP